MKRIVYGTSANQLTRVISARKYIGYRSKEIYARMAPNVEVAGPVGEEEGLKIHAAFWPDFLASKKSVK